MPTDAFTAVTYTCEQRFNDGICPNRDRLKLEEQSLND